MRCTGGRGSNVLPMTQASCSSLRFADDSGSPQVANLAALWGRDPALAELVDGATPGDLITVTPSKRGDMTATAKAEDGRSIQLHSRYDPIAEAAALINKAGTLDGLAYFVLGFGLGYHVQELVRRVPTTARIWVLEADTAVIAAAAERRDLAELFANPRVGIITSLDRPKLLNDFQPHGPLLVAGVTMVEHTPSVMLRPAFYADARQWLDEVQSYARTAVHTLVKNAGQTLRNVALNLPWYVTSPGIGRLANAYKNQPAIIVAAGPSLRKNRKLLREAKGHAVIIAVQTMLKPLLELGVEPDFVTSLDYSPLSARFFQDLPRDLKTELVAEAKATDVIFGLHTGPLTLVGSDLADDLLREAIRPRPRLKSGATVAHLAFYLAEYLGCDPIILVGQDLGFSDGLCYAAGTSYDDVWRPELGRFCSIEMKQWEQIARERPILRKIADQQGRPMYTEQRLFTYLQQFERDFTTSNATVIDASEGGAAKRGTRVMTLREALDAHCKRPLRSKPVPHAGPSDVALPAARAALEKRISDAETIRSIAEDVLPLLEEIRDNVDNQPRVNRAIAKIDPLRERMNGVGRAYDLVMYLSQQSEFDRFKTDLAIEGSDLDDRERQRRQTMRDIGNVRAVIAASDNFADVMREAIGQVDVFESRAVEAA